MSTEIYLIIVVVLLQLFFFTKTYLQVNKLSNLFPLKNKLKTNRVSIDESSGKLIIINKSPESEKQKSLKREVSEPVSQNEILETVDKILSDEKQKTPVERKSPTSSIFNYFLNDTDPSGFFWDDQKKSKFIPNEAAFELTIDPDDSTLGEFKIVNDEARHNILIASCDELLEPACELIGPKEGTKIISIKPGRVKLVKDKWQIEKKCIISIKGKIEGTDNNKKFKGLKSQKEIALEKEEIKSDIKKKYLKYEEYFLQSGKKYFLPAPERGGYFIDDDKSSRFIENQSAFVLLIDPNNDKRGFFKFIEDKTKHSYYLNNFSKYIESTCDYDQKPKKRNHIITLRGGILNLHDGEWAITTKSKIIIAWGK